MMMEPDDSSWRERLRDARDVIQLWYADIRDRIRAWLPPRTLHEAALRGDLRSLQKFLDRGAEPNTPDPFGSSALVYAAAQGHLDAVRLLLERGAHVDATLVKLLLEAGADVNAADSKGDTPLLKAAWLGVPLEVVSLLLERGAEVNAQNAGGQTALMLAAGWSSDDIVQLLLEHGADHAMADKKGRTALMYARHPLSVLPAEFFEPIIGLLEQAEGKS